jgi:hypothetical protein
MAESQEKGEASNCASNAAGGAWLPERDVLTASNQIDLTDSALEEVDKWEGRPAYDYAFFVGHACSVTIVISCHVKNVTFVDSNQSCHVKNVTYIFIKDEPNIIASASHSLLADH